MRNARALRQRGVAAGIIALACATPAHADELTRAEVAAGAEPQKPARPPLPPEPPPVHLPWEPHIEVGGDLALVQRFTSASTAPVHFQPALGYGLHARWSLFRYLQFGTYFVSAKHELEFLPGALRQLGTVETDPVETLVFGARLMPTLPLGQRVRLWPSIGLGYEHFDFSRITVRDPNDLNGASFRVHKRSASFVEIPLGLGVSIELIRHWVTLDLETSGAFVVGSGGEATQEAQTVDAGGHRLKIPGLPQVKSSFVQTFGLSIAL